MSVRDEGKTHFYGDECPGGHRTANMSVAATQIATPDLTRSRGPVAVNQPPVSPGAPDCNRCVAWILTAPCICLRECDSELCMAMDTKPAPVEANAREAYPTIGEACVFCAIIAGDEPATVVRRWSNAIAIVPLNPVTEGHTLVIPNQHVRDMAEDPYVTAATAMRVAELVWGSCNVITSRGRAATQSVFHLHWHIVPRAEDDGLALPWYSGRRTRSGGRG